jgi:2-dehydro-3-deoxyphosphogluconate aldolase/(4S)-4-hydroxy-2-oxoglutarate aldolase
VNTTIIDALKKARIVAILRGVDSKDILPVVDELVKAGISFIEFTFDHSNEAGSSKNLHDMRLAAAKFGNAVHIGAGTVLTEKEAETAAEAGAVFVVSPNTNADVIRRTKELHMLSMPGAMTPTEVAAAYNCGADIVKLFPAGNLGIAYIKALRSPLSHIPLMATGGVNPENTVDFIKAGCLCVGVGGNLVNLKEIAAKNYNYIAAEAQKYKAALHHAGL